MTDGLPTNTRLTENILLQHKSTLFVSLTQVQTQVISARAHCCVDAPQLYFALDAPVQECSTFTCVTGPWSPRNFTKPSWLGKQLLLLLTGLTWT